MSLTVQELITRGDQYLRTHNYAERTVNIYHSVWRWFKQYCLETNRVQPAREDIPVFFASRGLPKGTKLTPWQRQQHRIVNCLFDIGENCESPPRAYAKVRILLPECFAPVYAAYQSRLESMELTERTVYGKCPHASTTKAVYSMLLRTLWCCGLRLSEALSLRLGDVDSKNGVLTIRRAKYNQVRLIPLAPSLLEYLRIYWSEMGFSPENTEAFFFPNHRGGSYVRHGAAKHIQTIMLQAGITKDGVKSPRAHDIRHSYAIRALQKMADEGTDIYCALPMLSIFMGHSDIISTEYYLRLTGYAFPDVTGRMEKAYANVFLEVRQNG